MVLRIGFGDFSKGDIAALERILEPLDRAVGVGVDGVVNLHLQNKVGSTLQIKSKVDATLQRGQQTFVAQAARNTEDAKQKDDQHRNNQNCLGEKILVHDKTAILLRLGRALRGRQSDDRGAGNFDLDVVRRNTQDYGVILD